MGLKLVVKAVNTCLTLDFIKRHLVVDHDNDDDLLIEYVISATAHVEKVLSRALITKTYDYSIDKFEPVIELPQGETQSINMVTYLNTDNVPTLLPSTVYRLVNDDVPATLRLAYEQSWPDVLSFHNAVTIRFVSGYGDKPADVPFELRAAIALLVGHFYENREATVSGTIVRPVPMGFDRLIQPYYWAFF